MRAAALLVCAVAVSLFMVVMYYWIDTERVWRLNNK